MTSKIEVLKNLNIGKGVAEREVENLRDFFFESPDWGKVYSGEVDLIFGPKGAGKSAIYFLLKQHAPELRQRNILLVSGEKPFGQTVFRSVESELPSSERDFIALWKLYFAVLIVDTLSEAEIKTENFKKSKALLSSEGLYETGWSLTKMLGSISSYVKQRMSFSSVETSLEIDPITGVPNKISGKLSFQEPGPTGRALGRLPIDDLLVDLNNDLESIDHVIWILLDRLDVLFDQNKNKERTALRALFRVYGELFEFAHIRLKIFLRDDIWNDISEGGFREASHLIDKIDLRWDKLSLVNMIVRRLVHSRSFSEFYGLPSNFIMRPMTNKVDLIHSIVPSKMKFIGGNEMNGLDWILQYTKDGNDNITPRDLIEFFVSLKDYEINRFIRGESPPRHTTLLFSYEAMSYAAQALSKVKLEQTIYAEYPDLKPFIEQLYGSPTRNFDVDLLEKIWDIPKAQVIQVASKLADIGLFKKTGKQKYLVPALYTNQLSMKPK
jgi:hypothetical protein